jgi:hypothetical protein
MNYFYSAVGQFAVWAVPVAPAAFFSIKIYDALAERLGPMVALFVAVLGAAGFETVGILNGHAMVSFWQDKRYGMALAAALLLASYVTIGLYELGLTIGGVMILIGAIVYLTQGLLTSHNDTKAQRKLAATYQAERQEAERQAAQKAQERAAKLAADLERDKLQAQKEVAIARIKAGQVTDKPAQVTRNFPQDWRRMTDEQKAQIALMSVDELIALGIKRRTAQNWKQRAGN